jgi:hypothetical protein
LSKVVYKHRRKSSTKNRSGKNDTVIAVVAIAGLGLGALYLSGGAGGVFQTLSDAVGTIASGIGLGGTIGGAAAGGAAGAKILRSGGGGGSKGGGGGSKPSKPSSGDDFSGVKDPFTNENLSKISPAGPGDIPADFSSIKDPLSNENLSKIKGASQKDLDKLQKKASPSKSGRPKKSNTKKDHKTNDKKGTKPPDKPKPKPCEWWNIVCKLQSGDPFGTGGGAGIIPGLSTAPKIPLLA